MSRIKRYVFVANTSKHELPGVSERSAPASTRRRSRPKSRFSSLIIGCLLAIVTPISAVALAPPNFQIADEASYQAFKDAVIKTEYVRNAYIQDPKPRVIGSVAGLVLYATNNPLATDVQLATFIAQYDAKLSDYVVGDADPDLLRGSHLVAAVRFGLPLTGIVGLEGTNTNLGEQIVATLDIDIPPPDGFTSSERRFVRFEKARLRQLSESAAWANLLTVGFSGQDLDGNQNPNLAGVLQSYLEGEGYSPLAPCSECTDIGTDVLNALPIDYNDYQLLLEDVFAGGVVDAITDGYNAITLETTERVNELELIMTNEPSLVQTIANANNAAFVAQRQAAFLANLAKVDDERAIINANAMLLAQVPDASTQALADKAQRFASIQISQNQGLAAASEFVQIGGGLATLAFEFAQGKKRDPVELVGAGVDIVTSALGLGDIFGGGDDNETEQEILNQMAEMRGQLSDVQIQLNGRFDRIETQINVVYDALEDGFEFIGTQLGELQTNLGNIGASIEDIDRILTESNASLERIEDALWAISTDLLTLEEAQTANLTLDYRDDSGADFSYQNDSPNFIGAMSSLSTFAEEIALNTTYAGDMVSSVTVASAATDFDGAPIGRRINDLVQFPDLILNQSPLTTNRVPSPSIWARTASVYAQIARESPWYFAYQSRNGMPEVDGIIAKGERLRVAAAAARRQALFDVLFNAWRTELKPVTSVVYEAAVDPTVVGNLNVLGTFRDLEVSGNLAVAGRFSSLEVIGILSNTTPFTASSVSVPAEQVAINGTLALAAGGFPPRLRVFDLSVPAAPDEVGSFSLPGPIGDIAMNGDVALAGYTVTGSNPIGLQVIDISNPEQPIFTTVNQINYAVGHIAISGDLAFVSGSGADLQIIDISDPMAPQLRGSVNTPDSVSDIAVSGDLAVLAAGQSGLNLIDISDPMAPFLVGSLEYPCCSNVSAKSVTIRGELVFVANGVGGLTVVDISTPAAPVLLDSVDAPNDAGDVVALNDNRALVANDAGSPPLQVVEIFDWQGANWQGALNELNSGPLQNTKTNLQGYQNLVEAYITLGMPDLMEQSPIVRAALRSDASKGELAVGPVADIFTGFIMQPLTVTGWQVPANLQRLQDEVNAAIANPSVGHGYVDYMLAELEHLRDNALNLAVDDAYYTDFGVALAVPAGAGLLANDVDQEFRNIQVDLPLDQQPGYVAPQNGSVTANADGSFVYTPNPGFDGTDSFTYTSFTDVGPGLARSDPATVVIVVGVQTVAPPPNDGFSNPIALPGIGGSEQGTLSGAASDGSSSADSPDFPNEADVWYRFVAPADGTLRVNTCGSLALSNINTVLSVHADDGGPGTVANELAANDQWQTNGDPTANCPSAFDSSLALLLVAGDAVLIRVTRGDDIGNLEFVLNVSFEIDSVAPPPNDNFFLPISFPDGGGTELGTLAGATNDGFSSADPPGFPNAADVWYQFVATAAGTLRVNTCGSQPLSNINTVLSVHADDGGPGTVGNELAANDQWQTNGDPAAVCPSVFDSSLALPLVAGDAVLIRVSRGDAVGDLEFLLNVSFETQPETDADADGIFDSVDNCTNVPNPSQLDVDGDGYGNICDADFDQNCVVNFPDLGLMKANFFSPNALTDLDGNGVTNFTDLGLLKAAFFTPPGPSAVGSCLP